MRDYLTISCTPVDECCIQVLKDVDYCATMKKECDVFKRQLERQFPDAPDGTYFVVKSFPHDFGTYCEVCVSYDDEDEESYDFAFMVEANTPCYWDDEALAELGQIEGYYEMLNNYR